MHSILHFPQVLVNLSTSSLELSILQVIGKELGGIQSELIGVASWALTTPILSSTIESVVRVDATQFVELAMVVILATLALQACHLAPLGCGLGKAAVVSVRCIVELSLNRAL